MNIVVFQSITKSKIQAYQTEIASNTTTPNPERLKAFTEISTLDDKTRDEYNAVLQELSTISTALENISTNPELYLSSSGASSSTSISIWAWTGNKTIPEIFSRISLKMLWEDSPEWRLVTGVVRELIVVNFFWLIFVYLVHVFWIRSIFSPIKRVTESISKIVERRGYDSLRYTKDNEFFPLISAINNLQKSLSIQENIRHNFLSDLSHEIRTPITAVKCYLEAIEDGVMHLDDKTINLFKKELDRLAETTEQIMLIEKTTHEWEKNIHVERFGVKKTILPLIQEYLPQCQKNNQDISIDMPRDTMIRMDNSMFIQLIHNIFSNFIKYAGENTILSCSYEKTEDSVILWFRDNGIGIPEKDMPYIKEKFYRVDTWRQRDDKSMGIGLSIIERIMRIHGWKFVIENGEWGWLTILLTFPR